jgi:putative hydrolase of the HAD superfamily
MEALKVIFWDFDGTLAHRNGFFSEVLLEILDKYEPAHNYKIDDIRKYLKDGFPWHKPENPHFELNQPIAWWNFVENIFIQAYEGIGFENERAVMYAKLAHYRYIDSKGFSLYEDTEETLKYFVDRGWKNIILSNHVPELSSIISDLGLCKYIHECISSANIGYEKPNPEIFRYALRKAGNPQEVWMVGDNYEADVKGAENVGIKAILVRSNFEEEIKYYGKKLLDIIQIIENK